MVFRSGQSCELVGKKRGIDCAVSEVSMMRCRTLQVRCMVWLRCCEHQSAHLWQVSIAAMWAVAAKQKTTTTQLSICFTDGAYFLLPDAHSIGGGKRMKHSIANTEPRALLGRIVRSPVI
jgi:hypothetical protein